MNAELIGTTLDAALRDAYDDGICVLRGVAHTI